MRTNHPLSSGLFGLVAQLAPLRATLSPQPAPRSNHQRRPDGGPLHALCQEICEVHFKAQDKLAERIKALNAHAEVRYSDFLERSCIAEADDHMTAKKMVDVMRDNQEQLHSSCSCYGRRRAR